ncbi:aminoglycoside phosphotransferase family protein [Mediterraneibacter catenae]|uniref:Aminoglycoside phosphotransferase family protein n=1 Tax=Mediterraneibacter catenae TaxID=2594882 RepID=A0A5M9HYL6_9FIRM|nr:aminoglycoside phosphotransferase family protein [Mediterraneibacter catenae]KAA8501807.1 aminoglycoside phosphotransferase family protein [Mediterraneibacter catenae]
MKSKTKNRLSENKIKELVRIHFGRECETGEITELTGGMFNAIYRIERKNEKDAVILKVGVIPDTTLLTYERDIMPVEVECYRMIREQTTVPVPEVLAYDFSKRYIESNYFFMTELKGEPFSKVMKKMGQENADRIREELAGYLYQIHGVKGKYFGYFTKDERRQYSTWKAAFFHMFRQILADGREHRVKLPYARIMAALQRHDGSLEDVREPSLVEYDCHEGNIFVKKTGNSYTIEGILDFERAFWGDPIADFPTAFVFTDDIRKETAFLNAYLRVSGRNAYTETDAVKYQLYRMYILTIMAAETFRYGFLYGKLQGMWAKWQLRKCLRILGDW